MIHRVDHESDSVLWEVSDALLDTGGLAVLPLGMVDDHGGAVQLCLRRYFI